MGDGSDQYTQAAGQMAQAAKQFGQQAGKQAAVKSAEQTANAAAAIVKASAEGGKAAAEIAAGTAAGGPWGGGLGQSAMSFKRPVLALALHRFIWGPSPFPSNNPNQQPFWPEWYSALPGRRIEWDLSEIGIHCHANCGRRVSGVF